MLVLPNAACLDDGRPRPSAVRPRRAAGWSRASIPACATSSAHRGRPRARGRARHRAAGRRRVRGGRRRRSTRTSPAHCRRITGPNARASGTSNSNPRHSFLESPRITELIGKAPLTFKGPVVRVEARPALGARDRSAQGSAKGEPIPALVSGRHRRGPGHLLRGRHRRGPLRALLPVLSPRVSRGDPGPRHPRRRRWRWPRRCAFMPSPCARRRMASASIVHLFNDVNTTAGHGHPAEEVPLREEVMPIHDITVTFRRV